MMLPQFIDQVRQRYHPLWRLRRWAPYRWFQKTFDFPIGRRMGRVTRYAFFLRDFPTLLSSAVLEPRTLQITARLFRQCSFDCFVDVGANIGNYSWWVANEHPTAKLILFEPDANNLALLRRSIARSALRNAVVYPFALSNARGQARFINDDISGAVGSILDQRGTISNLQNSYRLTVESIVETRCLDEFLPELSGHRVLMKIDVEGAEALVLQGATRMLAEIGPVVILESFAGAGLKVLREMGYRIYAIGENSNYLAIPRAHEGLPADINLAEG